MRKIASMSLAVVFMASYAYSSDLKITFDNKGDLKSMIQAINESKPAAETVSVEAEKKGPKEWTIMVFVNAKNNLESYGLKDVNEMEAIGSNEGVNIVAELGRIDGYSAEDGDWKGSRRYLVQKDADTSKITSPVVMDIPKSDMGDWNHMVEFVKWSQTNYPAKKYVLVIWNHGSGWNKDLAAELGKGISYDDETGNHITTAQLKLALDKTGKIDILSMDACLMQMIEVAYEVKDNTDFIVASEETEPGDGYTYDTFLGPLAAKPGMSAAELSKTMVDAYTNHYQAINQGATQSSVKTASIPKFTAMVGEFVDALVAGNDVTNAKNARTKAQAFYYSSNKDIYHFVKLVVDATQVPAVKAKGQALLDFMKGSLIYHNRATGAKYANAFGLAGYLPSYYTASYDELLWAKDSKWDEMMKWIKTQENKSVVGTVWEVGSAVVTGIEAAGNVVPGVVEWWTSHDYNNPDNHGSGGGQTPSYSQNPDFYHESPHQFENQRSTK